MKLTQDARHWRRKWSTWLGAVAASAAGGLGVYAMAPERAQNLVPDWALGALITVGIVAGLLVPLATSIAQASCETEENV
ncbi:hypothetical protein [Lysobacter capsici]|uniref:DUF7940 domain-containing protein n=1 Tax=Lysobacter capsici TaxID=435897 RepID=UPI00287BB2D0|nr:hypothetical protein [Lysobacter capsici]WND79397.1 hypothetical protein RJ610_19150 [Lysobacter capsici]WND84593.1 hypothetical protein RJ609_19165 [Lysobacter capsici]